MFFGFSFWIFCFFLIFLFRFGLIMLCCNLFQTHCEKPVFLPPLVTELPDPPSEERSHTALTPGGGSAVTGDHLCFWGGGGKNRKPWVVFSMDLSLSLSCIISLEHPIPYRPRTIDPAPKIGPDSYLIHRPRFPLTIP